MQKETKAKKKLVEETDESEDEDFAEEETAETENPHDNVAAAAQALGTMKIGGKKIDESTGCGDSTYCMDFFFPWLLF